jgi:hypothetical protein
VDVSTDSQDPLFDGSLPDGTGGLNPPGEHISVPHFAAMELVGHKTESVYQRCDIVSEKDLTDGVKIFAAWRARMNTTSRSSENGYSSRT